MTRSCDLNAKTYKVLVNIAPIVAWVAPLCCSVRDHVVGEVALGWEGTSPLAVSNCSCVQSRHQQNHSLPSRSEFIYDRRGEKLRIGGHDVIQLAQELCNCDLHAVVLGACVEAHCHLQCIFRQVPRLGSLRLQFGEPD